MRAARSTAPCRYRFGVLEVNVMSFPLVPVPLAAPLAATAGGTPLRFDPAMASFLALLAAGYAAGWYRVHRRGLPWRATRVLWFAAGLAGAALLTMGWPGGAANRWLWTYTTQVTLLLVVVPVLLIFGRPVTLLALALPHGAAARFSRVLASRPVRALTGPAVAPIYVPIALAALFFTHLLPLTLRSDAALQATQVLLLLIGLIFAMPLAGEDREHTTLSLAAGIFIGFIELFLDAVPGIVVRLTTHPLAGAYFAAQHTAPGAVMRDQHLAGAILWFLAEVVDLPFLAIMVWQWIQLDRREAARVDRELDEAAIVRVAATGDGAGAGTGPAEIDGYTRPWWETNPDVFADQRAAVYGRRPAGGTAGGSTPAGGTAGDRA